MLFIAATVYIYYTTWVFILPFIDNESFIQQFFLPRDYAIKIPIFLLLLGGVGVATFVGNVLLKEAEKERLKKQGKKLD